MARCGYVAEGLIYVLVGGFGMAVALHPGELPQGSAGALSQLGDAPLGMVMLAVLALGLAAFVFWQGTQALFDPEYRSDRWTPKRLAARVGCLMNAALHAVLVGDVVWLVFGFGRPAGHGKTQALWTARAMQLPLGRWAVAATGIGIVIFALVQFNRAATGARDCRVDLAHTRWRRLIRLTGQVGYAARGVTFGLVGALLLGAAWRHDATKARGIAGALNTLREQPFGLWLLGVVAFGLIAYGIFQIAEAPFRVLREV
ncbi:MAG: DUF1206 domain-containing protein [Rhodanobacter sp.]